MNHRAEGHVSRRAFLGTLAGLAAISAAPAFANTPAVLTGAGDIRRLRLTSRRTGESIDTVYWVEGHYVTEALEELSFFMRDWRQNAIIDFDPQAFDVMAATQQLLETSEPFNVLSGYRTASTNAMLRRRSRGVARNSYHMRGMAADLRMQSRSANQVYHAAASVNGGGVGRYGRSGFVHVDSGPVRTWRR
ncbi:MAG: DUF882 domain-containing protein [Pseudomonadota bacterium]